MSSARQSDSARERLLSILLSKAFKSSETPTFRLASGAMSRFYVNCKEALCFPEARDLAGRLFLEMADLRELDAVGGPELGAIPIAMAISDAAYRERGADLPALIIRKKPKDHGLKKLVEGVFKANDRMLLVEDVVTTGGSTIDAIRHAREAGLTVDRVFALIDRQEEDGAAKIEALGVRFRSLFTISDLNEARRRAAPPVS